MSGAFQAKIDKIVEREIKAVMSARYYDGMSDENRPFRYLDALHKPTYITAQFEEDYIEGILGGGKQKLNDTRWGTGRQSFGLFELL